MPEEVPDLYEVLSVQRWADQSLIEAQYQRKHDAYVQAGQDTEELEEAYAILSDPESRAEYDDMLFSYDAEVFDDELEAEGIERSGSSWSFMKIASWGFSAVILVSLLSGIVGSIVGGGGGGGTPASAQTAGVVRSTEPPRNFGQVSTFELRDDECFNEPNALTTFDSAKPMTIVPCFGAYDYRVLNTIATTLNGIIPLESYFGQQAATHCDDRTDVYYLPTEVSWNLGDRTILCLQAYSG
jgi:curved DNA-binding protein CbpA